MDKNNLSKKVGLLIAGCFITFNALGQTTIKGQVVDVQVNLSLVPASW